jgi:hypothetical protein
MGPDGLPALWPPVPAPPPLLPLPPRTRPCVPAQKAAHVEHPTQQVERERSQLQQQGTTASGLRPPAPAPAAMTTEAQPWGLHQLRRSPDLAAVAPVVGRSPLPPAGRAPQRTAVVRRAALRALLGIERPSRPLKTGLCITPRRLPIPLCHTCLRHSWSARMAPGGRPSRAATMSRKG